MLKTHMDAIEEHLVAVSRIPANSGHSLHKWTPREAFIKEFLEKHLSENVAIWTWEIIDANSQPNIPRNQYDIVIYKKNYPKLDFWWWISWFLIESVIATIEIKSLLDQEAFDQSIKAANNAKKLEPNISKGFSSWRIPPKVLNYVVAYDWPRKMSTVWRQINNSHSKLKISLPYRKAENRILTAWTALDWVFILKRWFLILENTPLTLNSQNTPDVIYSMSDSENGNILMLFLALQEACNNIEWAWLDPIAYVKKVKVKNVKPVFYKQV